MSSSSSAKEHDVFISFRGPDSRNNFISHLHSALLYGKSIRTYIDDRLKKGADMWPALCQAIHDSHIAIVVFTENYASSGWCLDELVEILKCRKNPSHGQVVIPVFYELDPSHVRHQIGKYKSAFEKYEQLFRHDKVRMRKIPAWKKALGEAANMSGWDSRSRDFKNDSELIEKIVEDVLQKLYMKFPPELEVERLVGIDRISECVESLLSTNKPTRENVKKIGIWGMGGIGKTTIAKVMFSRLFPQYDSVCFLEKVSDELKRVGKTTLRGKLLSELLKEEKLKFHHVESKFTKRRFDGKKVFIVLDDVDKEEQIEALWKEGNEVAAGSKLIITTRNRSLLHGKRADEIYDVQILNSEESSKLFCLHAFKQNCPDKGFEDLSNRALEYARGVPLALKVLGSNLYSRDTEFWVSELKKIKNYPYDDIRDVLQVSYDGLGPMEKEIFLDIAFFFKDENKDFVKRILDACGFSATSGIKILEDKALITISNGNRIQMHDLLQDMGLNIVRQDIKNPGKRSRLRDIEEVSNVLENKKESDAVEGIQLNLSEINDLHLNADAFHMMDNLRFLMLYIPAGTRSGNVKYPKMFNKFPTKLRYLDWHGYRLKCLPATFSAKMLIEIRLPHSHVIELWSGVKDVVNLEGIDLSECKLLKNLPDLSKATKLKWVNLTGCESLLVVHPSVLSLDTLETLILDNCKKLKILTSEKHLRSLKNLSMDGCTSLDEFSVSSDSIESLDFSETGIQKLHSSIGNLMNLESLRLKGMNLRNLPDELCFLKSLRDLRISNCTLVMDKQKLCGLFEGLRSLVTLHLMDCCKMFELPDNINGLLQLYELKLDGSSVQRLPGSIKCLQNLQILSLNDCRKLQCLPELPLYITVFSAANCSSLVALSTLKTFARCMRGDEKYISFENCMKLNGDSLCCIMEDTQLTMMNALIQNSNVDSLDLKAQIYNYNLVKVCLPGSEVPKQFTHRTTEPSLIVTLPSKSKLLGIILCAILSPSEELMKHDARIWCQCYLPDGKKLGQASTFYRETITKLSSDHVYIWCDSFHFDSILEGSESDECQVSFKFHITNDKKEPEVLKIHTKQCGVYLVSNDKGFNDINNPAWDLRGKSSCCCDCLSTVVAWVQTTEYRTKQWEVQLGSNEECMYWLVWHVAMPSLHENRRQIAKPKYAS